MTIEWFLLWTNLNPLHPRMLCAKFGLNWPNGSGEDFYISSMYWYFIIISFWKRSMPFIWTYLNPCHPRMLCAKFHIHIDCSSLFIVRTVPRWAMWPLGLLFQYLTLASKSKIILGVGWYFYTIPRSPISKQELMGHVAHRVANS